MKDFLLKYPPLKHGYLIFINNKRNIYLGFSILIFLLILMLWYIVNSQIELLKNDIARDNKLLVLLVPAKTEINKLRIANHAVSTKHESLVVLIDQESKINAWNKAIMDMKQINSNQVDVVFNRIYFDDFISGLENIVEKNNINILKVSVKRIETTNAIQAYVSLQLR